MLPKKKQFLSVILGEFSQRIPPPPHVPHVLVEVLRAIALLVMFTTALL